MEKFIQSRLEELRSQQETRNLIGELSSRIMDHRGRVRQLLCNEPLRHPEVVPLILVGMAAYRLLKSNFFPGLLEGLLGSLGIAAPGEGNPPSSSQEGAGHAWSSAVCEAMLWGCLKAWISVTRRISSENKDIKYHRSSWTQSSSLIWLRQCSRWSSPQWC